MSPNSGSPSVPPPGGVRNARPPHNRQFGNSNGMSGMAPAGNFFVRRQVADVKEDPKEFFNLLSKVVVITKKNAFASENHRYDGYYAEVPGTAIVTSIYRDEEEALTAAADAITPYLRKERLAAEPKFQAEEHTRRKKLSDEEQLRILREEHTRMRDGLVTALEKLEKGRRAANVYAIRNEADSVRRILEDTMIPDAEDPSRNIYRGWWV